MFWYPFDSDRELFGAYLTLNDRPVFCRRYNLIMECGQEKQRKKFFCMPDLFDWVTPSACRYLHQLFASAVRRLQPVSFWSIFFSDMPCWSQVGQSLYSVSKHLALYLNMHTNRASPTQPLSIKCSYRNLSFGKGRPVTGMGFSFCSVQDFLRGLCSPRAVTHRQHIGRSTLNSREAIH